MPRPRASPPPIRPTPRASPRSVSTWGASRAASSFTCRRARRPRAPSSSSSTAAGFAVAYPAGTDDEWNDCRFDAPANGTVDEVAFLDAVLDRLQADLSLGAGRTFLAGGSNGGMMAFSYAFHRPARLAAVATSSASLAAKPKPGPCTTGPDRPIPFLLSHGTADPALPYAGGCVVQNVTGTCNRGTVLSGEATRDWFVARNVPSGTPSGVETVDVDTTDPGPARLHRWDGPTQLRWWELVGAGHTAPSRTVLVPGSAAQGRQNRDVEFAEIAWSFFADVARLAPAAQWLLPSAARAPGAGGAFYTTDLAVANTGAADATLTLKFLGHDADGRGGPEKTFALAAGRSVTYGDLLGSVFGVDSGYGAVRIASSTSTLAVTSLTSTPSSSGGTFGQSVPAFGDADLLREGPPRTIAAVREDPSFRTNLVLASAVETPLDVDVTLLADTGAALASARYALPPLGMRQVTRVVRDLGVAADVAGARLVLSTPTPGGAFAAYAALIDNVTNDPRTLLPSR